MRLTRINLIQLTPALFALAACGALVQLLPAPSPTADTTAAAAPANVLEARLEVVK